MSGKCPKCESSITSVKIDGVTAKSGSLSWKAITYLCPYCSTILSVQIDPIAVKNDIVKELKR